MKIAFIVQRYGLDVTGGSELLCRCVAEHLSKYYDIEVLTTCAKDYITWRNEYKEGTEIINSIPVRRFRVAKERDIKAFGLISRRIFKLFHTKRGELKWLELQGPYSPDLLNYLAENEERYDLFIFFTYRYWFSYHGVMSFPHKSFLIPTAEDEPSIYLKIFRPVFNKPKAIIYCTVEEKELINQVSANHAVPDDIIGMGVDLPKKYDPQEFRKKHNIHYDYVIYVGRIDPNKGCQEMFDYFIKFFTQRPSLQLKLILIGNSIIQIPVHENIVHLGYLPDEDKFGAIKASRFLIMPSPYESLSIVTLEAWFLSKAVLVNGRCKVLKGQCQRSNGGLYYRNYEEFEACMDHMLDNGGIIEQLGRQGNAYVEANYTWEIIEDKYRKLIEPFAAQSSCAIKVR